jgi:hypothetical protein
LPGTTAGCEVRHRSARDEDAFGVGGEAEHLGDPAHDARLDVDRRVVAAPAVRVHGGGEVVGDDADRIRRGVDEAVEARVGVAHRIRQDVLAHERQHFLERPALFRDRLVEERGPRADLSEDRAVEQPLPMRGHGVGGERAQAPQLFRRQVEGRPLQAARPGASGP